MKTKKMKSIVASEEKVKPKNREAKTKKGKKEEKANKRKQTKKA